MKHRTLITTLVLTAALTGCRGADETKDRLSSLPSPQATAAEPTAGPTQGPSTDNGECQASGEGTTDLTKKPVYTVTKAAPPTETTTTDIVCGKGAQAKEGSTVVAKYVGLNYANGEEFDSSWKVSADNTFEFQVGGNVIPGFSKGATGMREGGRRLVVIPPADGYGDSGPVPGGTLVFLIDLVKVS